MQYFVKFRKAKAKWDTVEFDCFAEAQTFQLRLQDVGYEAELTWVEQWDKTDMVHGEPDYHHDIFAFC